MILNHKPHGSSSFPRRLKGNVYDTLDDCIVQLPNVHRPHSALQTATTTKISHDAVKREKTPCEVENGVIQMSIRLEQSSRNNSFEDNNNDDDIYIRNS